MRHIPPVPTTLPPFALAPPVFRFRHLAALAGRAPIGGAREVALACFVVARLAAERVGAGHDDQQPRTARSLAAKAWLGTLALPNPVRGSATRCAELGADGDRAALIRELQGLVVAASGYLDGHSRTELDALARSLEG
ncbi:hypothetical protein BH09GEM1_BH09GEM1_38100 [soil metagenome]